MTGWRWWVAFGIVLAVALAATVPTTGDIGLTWDEPAYRYSQVMSAQWWERLSHAKSLADLSALVEPDTLLYYWPYGRYGRNFHPPLAGQLNLATHAVFGRWWKDIPSRRLASVFEFALTIAIGFGFLARRYGPWVGGVMAGSLLLMPRVYGDGHIAGTDTPGLWLWAATALAFWKGLHEPGARRWRVLVGVLVGLAFVEKMAAVLVVGPLVSWLVLARVPRTFFRPGARADWIDGVVTTSAMLLPLGLAFLEVLRLSREFVNIQRGLGIPLKDISPSRTDLFNHPPPSELPGAILALPLAVWLIRRLVGRLRRSHPVWGVERPALEIWTAILAAAPFVGWLGNPAWWRETLPRLAHYYMITGGRRGSLPDIQILYFGQTYEYSLPWHNAWTLIAITVPASILASSVLGLIYAIRSVPRDRLPLYFLVHLVTLPAMRMLETPAHDGVRLFLPTFFFLAAMAGWGSIWLADGVARLFRARAVMLRGVLAALVLGPAAWQLVRVHPFELSYYNELIGGPRGAWKAGFELSYWYDAFNDRTLADLNRKLPRGAAVVFFNDKTNPDTFYELQSLGHLRKDIVLGLHSLDEFPYVWLLTQDSKASAFTRLLFAMTPFFAREPKQLDGLRVATVADPVAVSRACALWILTDAAAPPGGEGPRAPAWVRRYTPWLRRFWGEGVTRVARLGVNTPIFEWARTDPDGLRAAARAIASHQPLDDKPAARRLMAVLLRSPGYRIPEPPKPLASEFLLRARPKALVEAVEILIARPDAVRTILQRYPYTDPDDVGGYLDRDLKQEAHPG
jgi:hypothetical protein